METITVTDNNIQLINYTSSNNKLLESSIHSNRIFLQKYIKKNGIDCLQELLLLFSNNNINMDLSYNNINCEILEYIINCMMEYNISSNELILDYNNILNINTILKYIDKFTIEKLSLRNNEIDCNGITQFINLLNNCNLRSLDLYNNMIGDKGCNIIMNSIINNNITILNLGMNCITENGIMIIASILEKKTNLTNLNLSNNNLTDDSIKIIAQGLYHENSNLQHLDIGCNEITTNGAIIISKMLKKNNKLKTIILERNKIDSIKWLKYIFNNNTTLTYLDIYNNLIDSSILIKFEKLRKRTCFVKYIRNEIIEHDSFYNLMSESTYV